MDVDNDKDDQRPEKKPRRRDDRPKTNPKEDFGYRINGLEQAKLEPGMSQQDIAALDRAIEKLRLKKAEKEAKPVKEEDQL